MCNSQVPAGYQNLPATRLLSSRLYQEPPRLIRTPGSDGSQNCGRSPAARRRALLNETTPEGADETAPDDVQVRVEAFQRLPHDLLGLLLVHAAGAGADDRHRDRPVSALDSHGDRAPHAIGARLRRGA